MGLLRFDAECPPVPLLRGTWNSWFVFARSDEVDQLEVQFWLKNLISANSDNVRHDVQVTPAPDLTAVSSIIGEFNVLWRLSNCKPLPNFPSGTPVQAYLVEFVTRGPDLELQWPGSFKAKDAKGVILSRVLDVKKPAEVPEAPPDIFERIEKGAEEATDFYKQLAVIAVVAFAIALTI